MDKIPANFGIALSLLAGRFPLLSIYLTGAEACCGKNTVLTLAWGPFVSVLFIKRVFNILHVVLQAGKNGGLLRGINKYLYGTRQDWVHRSAVYFPRIARSP